MQQQLTDFVLKTDGFSKHCYGEIMFKERGFKSTFSPVSQILGKFCQTFES